MYELPLPSQLLENVPTKIKWKKMVNKAINSVVELQWQEDISISSTLKYINPESLKVGRAHHVWSSVRNSVHDSRRAQLKSRLLTWESAIAQRESAGRLFFCLSCIPIGYGFAPRQR